MFNNRRTDLGMARMISFNNTNKHKDFHTMSAFSVAQRYRLPKATVAVPRHAALSQTAVTRHHVE